MKELEVKILEINGEKVQHKLDELGAEKLFEGDIKTLFLDFGDGKIHRAKDVLRLRAKNGKTELTYKKVSASQKAKQAEELSVEVSSLELARQILEQLGLHITQDMLKHRASYKLNSVHFDIDRFLDAYKFIPEFLEIEAEDIDAIYRNAELLGFKVDDCLPWSTDELIQHYAHKIP